jgi:hypothetical protein
MPPGHGLEGIDNLLANMCYLQTLPRTSDTLYPIQNLPEGFQFPLTRCDNFSRGLPIMYGTFARKLPQLHAKVQP